ncbi:hypothetical protein RV13_GL003018 [Enterococcus raffinosus]|nr:hypothetical protein RV13_GL003018 [Enterococcus raffinosus]
MASLFFVALLLVLSVFRKDIPIDLVEEAFIEGLFAYYRCFD